MVLKFLTLAFWNNLARSHLSDIVMILSAIILVLLDKPVRQVVDSIYKPKSRLFRFVLFVIVCSFGYAALAVVTARVLRFVLVMNGGAYIAPFAIVILIATGIIAAKQKHI